jgi:hypothetical protein
MTSATASTIPACRSTSVGKGGKYTVSLMNPHKKKYSGVKAGKQHGHIKPTI